jgi:hypothetical protein
MTCSDVRRVLPEMMDGAPESAFHNEFDDHVRHCPECSGLVSDLDLIASEAPRLAANEEPGPHVWAQIAAQLRAEGVIRESANGESPVPEFQALPARSTLVPRSQSQFRFQRWSAWWLAPVAAVLIAAGAYVVNHKPAPPVAKVQAPASSPAATGGSEISANAPASTAPPAVTPASTAVTSRATATSEHKAAKAGSEDEMASAAKSSAEKTLIEPETSADDQQFLSEVSTRAPSMRATYESQLRAVNADIRESQAYLDQNPGDADARQHLMDAYQQKALLYQIALDRIQ